MLGSYTKPKPNKIMLQKLKEHKWTILAVVLALIVVYYFYQKNYGKAE